MPIEIYKRNTDGISDFFSILNNRFKAYKQLPKYVLVNGEDSQEIFSALGGFSEGYMQECQKELPNQEWEGIFVDTSYDSGEYYRNLRQLMNLEKRRKPISIMISEKLEDLMKENN